MTREKIVQRICPVKNYQWKTFSGNFLRENCPVLGRTVLERIVFVKKSEVRIVFKMNCRVSRIADERKNCPEKLSCEKISLRKNVQKYL